MANNSQQLRLETDILGPLAGYPIQEAIARNLTWNDVCNLRRTSRSLQHDEVLTKLEEGDAAGRGWLIPCCMAPTHATRIPEHRRPGDQDPTAALAAMHPEHPNQHNCQPESQPAPEGHEDPRAGCPHTQAGGHELKQCSMHPGDKPFLVCSFHRYPCIWKDRGYPHHGGSQRLDNLCDDCLNDLYRADAPTCDHIDLVYDDICVYCFDKAVRDKIAWCPKTDPDFDGFQCQRCLRKRDDPTAYPLRRSQKLMKEHSWSTSHDGTVVYRGWIVSFCEPCQRLVSQPEDAEGCTSPTAACNCDWHALYRYIRAERDPHPPMVPITDFRSLHEPPATFPRGRPPCSDLSLPGARQKR